MFHMSALLRQTGRPLRPFLHVLCTGAVPSCCTCSNSFCLTSTFCGRNIVSVDYSHGQSSRPARICQGQMISRVTPASLLRDATCCWQRNAKNETRMESKSYVSWKPSSYTTTRDFQTCQDAVVQMHYKGTFLNKQPLDGLHAPGKFVRLSTL